jgi:hypothetical protein
MYRLTSLALMALTAQMCLGQIFLGQQETPSPAETISEAPYFGQDFTGGYQVGDNVANFQIFDPSGSPVRLSELLEEGKPVILTTGSASCVRFVNTFNLDATDVGNHIARQYMIDHMDDFTWVFIYGYEAHPGDTANCTSNCPALTIPAPNGDTIWQHQQYSDRLEALQLWQNIIADPDYNFEFPFHMYADNPNNGVYNNFFERPFGSVVMDCQGEVLKTSEWTNIWLGSDEGQDFLNGLLDPSITCEPGAYECTGQSLDSDEDGICDEQELWQGWDPNDPNDPNVITSIEDLRTSQFTAYPNPFDDILNLSNTTIGDQIQLWDMQGRLAGSIAITASQTLDLSSLENGVYTLVLTSKNGKSSSQLVVKQ